jgi:purine-binding chemotaxis protein CheW
MEVVNNAVDSKQYIVVKIGNEQYGINIKYIDNIVRMQRITRVPKAQHYFKGVINLRGEIIPVMSLRLKFGLEADIITNAIRIIIVKLDAQSPVGIIVDEVKEVVTLDDENVEKVNNTAVEDKNGFLIGIGKHKGELISLLNITNVIVEKDANQGVV